MKLWFFCSYFKLFFTSVSSLRGFVTSVYFQVRLPSESVFPIRVSYITLLVGCVVDTLLYGAFQNQMVVKTFMDMDQDSEEEKELYLNLALHLASDFFLKHPDKDVRLLVACCLADIFRIYAPEAPYTSPDKLKVGKLNIYWFECSVSSCICQWRTSNVWLPCWDHMTCPVLCILWHSYVKLWFVLGKKHLFVSVCIKTDVLKFWRWYLSGFFHLEKKDRNGWSCSAVNTIITLLSLMHCIHRCLKY